MWLVLLLCFIAAIADVLGGALTVIKKFNQKEIFLITSLGTGFLLGATLLDRLPESLLDLPDTAPLYITIGYLILLVLSRLNHHHHGNTPIEANLSMDTFSDNHGSAHSKALIQNQKSVMASFLSLLFHTFIDGVIIAGAFTINESTGILIFLAITLHKIPEGFSMASLFLAAGSSRGRALLTSAGLALSTIIGAVVTLQLKTLDSHLINILMALATGTFLYISTSELIPVVRGRFQNLLAVVIGVVLFYGSLLLVKHVGLG
ncbi:ZIP family metal transporter [Pullulanibacillus sp. KACC 23026]|uniref:ZIP family metal transporter n=1 Tax=Pullulanibacillus sp. KACC 23026 TaxID=3028315 RepID=UPI0023B068C9|nr:ZIP family metal transporter [Pullulanibacillus sp. KACC 23026]WEG11858.1 ZIP family metal transporter [Pullulanibacillus sp. KACC 23026]